MDLNCIFFAQEGEMGLTETSANHLCALAKEQKKEAEKFLENVSFVDSYINIVGSDVKNQTNVGLKEPLLQEIKEKVEFVARMNEFIAWFAEARKHLETYKKKRNDLGIEDFCKEQGIKYPKCPEREEMGEAKTFEDMVETLPIKERELYLALEAKASVYGNFIHSEMPMNKAREELIDKIQHPFNANLEGANTIITQYVPSVEFKSVDTLYNELQAEYRKIEQQLNHMKAEIRTKLAAENVEIQNKNMAILQKFQEDMKEYNIETRQILTKFNQFRTEEEARLAKIKLAIPDRLIKIMNYLNSLG